MKRKLQLRGPGSRAVAVLLVLFALAAALPASARAHLKLQSAEPAADAALAVAPDALHLTFTRPVETAFADLTLLGPRGEVALGEVTGEPGTDAALIAPITGPLEAGGYTVRWQVAGEDGHPIRGEYSFTIQPGAAGLATVAGPTAPGQVAPPAEHHATAPAAVAFDAESPLYVVVRWLTFVGLLGTIGAVAFRMPVLWMVRRREGVAADEFVERAARGAAAFGVVAVGLLAGVLILRLYAQSVALHGIANALDGGRIAAMLTRTTWGWGWGLQAVGTALAGAGLLAARRGDHRTGWMVALLGALTLAFSPALSGHAAAEGGSLAILSDGLHVLGAGGWLGTLLFVVIVGLPVALRLDADLRGRTVAELISAFSPTAMLFAGVVTVTGVFAAWLHLGGFAELWGSGYGRTLLLKLGLLSVVFGTGAYNWRRVRPTLGTECAADHLRRSATLELAAGTLVLVVTAFLVATPPPDMGEMEMAAAPRTVQPEVAGEAR